MLPRFYAPPKAPYNPRDVNPLGKGVSFDASDKSYIVIFPIVPASIIQMVQVGPNTNVNRIRVMFLDEHDTPFPAEPGSALPLMISSPEGEKPSVTVKLNKKIHFVHVTLVQTTDRKPPRGVTVEIFICKEPVKTTPRITQQTSTIAPKPTTPGKILLIYLIESIVENSF